MTRDVPELERAVPADHRYRLLEKQVSACIESLAEESDDSRFLRMIVLQIYENMDDGLFLHVLNENFCARWFCGYSLLQVIPSPEEYARYKLRIPAKKLSRLVKQTLGSPVNPDAFVKAMNCVLGDTDQKELQPQEDIFMILIFETNPALAEELVNDPEIDCIDARQREELQILQILSSREHAEAVLSRFPQTAVGLAAGDDWERTYTQARYSFYQQRNGRKKLHRFYDESEENNIQIINLSLAGKRLALEEFLKESRLDDAYAMFEDIAGQLMQKETELHWFQMIHEMVKLYCSLYNGGLHYGDTARFYTDYVDGLTAMERFTLRQGIAMMRERLHSFDARAYQEIVTADFSDWANKAREMIETHYAEDLSLGEVARGFGITPEYLSSIFRKSTGRNFKEYLTDIRIENACRLLQQREMKVSDVARLAGFDKADYFGKVFKNRMHMTPGQYQKSKA